MTPLAVVLVVAAAILHALWNLMLKRAAGDTGPAFVWLFSVLGAVFFAPAAIASGLLQPSHVGITGALFVLGSGVLHVAYYLLLQRGYRIGDLSIVYPIARGSGPVLTVAAAIAFVGERPSVLALVGTLLVVAGVFVMSGGPAETRLSAERKRHGLVYGVLVGVSIAAYTLWDRHAVAEVGISPMIYVWGETLVLGLLLMPLAARRRRAVRTMWDDFRREAIVVAALSPLAYLLVLAALVFTPVSYVAPARELSIVFGTAMGSRLLAEGDAARRLLAAATIVVGVVALALG